MKRIVVATDFSARSDRAIRRATLLAKVYGSPLTMVHVIDDDQPKRIVKAEREASSVLLSEQARSLREIDGVDCDYRIILGNAFEGIAKAAEEINTDLLVIGPHRRQALKDVFVGTTAERSIRASSLPILMVNGVPAACYRHVLVAVDFSDCSAAAVLVVTDLGLERHAVVSVVHVFDAPGAGLTSRLSFTEDEANEFLFDMEQGAIVELEAFLGSLKFDPVRRIVKHNNTSVASTICVVAQEISADLVVVGTHGRSGVSKLILGSVAEEVLRTGNCDVLAVPPSAISRERIAVKP